VRPKKQIATLGEEEEEEEEERVDVVVVMVFLSVEEEERSKNNKKRIFISAGWMCGGGLGGVCSKLAGRRMVTGMDLVQREVNHGGPEQIALKPWNWSGV
jgi:hypothetical protein